MAGHGRKKKHHEEEHENEERWLVSFADMMTLLFALFMVLFSMSSVNVSKVEALQASLTQALSGKILPGGEALLESGAASATEQAPPEPPIPAITPVEAIGDVKSAQSAQESAEQARQEQEDFEELKRRIDGLVEAEGLEGRVNVTVRDRGLTVQLLTDEVFFASGSAELKAGAAPLLRKLARVISGERTHPVVVEGYTDAQPIGGGRYSSNWELSGSRAATVVERFEAGGVNRNRMSLTGFGEQNPVASNAAAAGRSKNRRVEVVLSRIYQS